MKKSVEKREIKNPIFRFLILAPVTGFGLGYSPKAPGTAGSILGIPLGLYLLSFPIIYSVGIILVLTLFFSWLSQLAGNHWGQRDSGKIVIDEVLGQALTLIGLWKFSSQSGDSVWSQINNQPSLWVFWILVGFGLFRLFDITKPFPAKSLDNYNSGLGVMGDDTVAGIYAALILRFATQIIN
jgi:phosphatidylglycerophosphatase A